MEENHTPDSTELPNIPDPWFEIGTKVRWNLITSDYASAYPTDRGIIRGMRYVWSEDIRNWQYQYYIALDLDSPSYEWTKFDWGWQEDLSALFSSNFQPSDRTKEKTDNDQ